jgi:hypothetical protein
MKLMTMLTMCTICGVAFLYFTAKLAEVVFPLKEQRFPTILPQSSKPNLRDPSQDDVVPEPKELSKAEEDEINRGKRLTHGIDMALGKFRDYNADAERVAKAYGSETMLQEVRRDIKMLSANDDDWQRGDGDDSNRPAPTFTTYNTLTNV